jgi:hypothetical protein
VVIINFDDSAGYLRKNPSPISEGWRYWKVTRLDQTKIFGLLDGFDAPMHVQLVMAGLNGEMDWKNLNWDYKLKNYVGAAKDAASENQEITFLEEPHNESRNSRCE